MPDGTGSDSQSGPGTHQGFMRLADGALPGAYRLAAHILTDPTDAEDAVQEALVLECVPHPQSDRVVGDRRSGDAIVMTALRILLAAVFVAACSSPLESPGPSTPGVPSATVTGAVASVSEAAPPIMLISTDFTTPMLDATTDGREIIWSTGLHADAGAAPDLWHYLPGSPQPQIVYHDPRREAQLLPIAVDQGRYAFVEIDQAAYGVNGYRLWFVPSLGTAPIEVDRGDWRSGEPNRPLPRMSLRGDRLVWVAVHRVDGKLVFELLQYAISNGVTTVLDSADTTALEFWNPSLTSDGQRLVYATVATVGSTSEFHVWYRDLATAAAAVRLDPGGSATNPVLSGTTVLWKQASANVFDRGSLVWGQLPPTPGFATGTRPIVEMSQVTEPSAGARFAAAWRDQDHELRVVELATGNTRVLAMLPASAPEALVRPEIAGDLLVIVHGYLDNRPLQLGWIDLSGYR